MKPMRNVITLSNMDSELEEWAREEARRRGIHFYEVINHALRIYQVVNQSLQPGGKTPRKGDPLKEGA